MKLQILKKYLWVFLIFLLIAICIGLPHLKYGVSQFRGQLNILSHAQPIEEVLNDPNIPDSVKTKINFVTSIKQFAINSLGITPTHAYTTVFVQKGQPVLKTVTACQPYELKDHTWYFPIVGTVSYKGFFDFEMLNETAQELKEEGYDVAINEITTWSTLGWFDDPILTNFLAKPDGKLANLIIHELTHGTVFVSGDVYFNENMASFIGHKGAILYLKAHAPEELPLYLQHTTERHLISNFVLQKADELETLYSNNQKKSISEKQLIKDQFYSQFRHDFLQLPVNNIEHFLPKDTLLNNTFFQSYRRYCRDLSQFEKEYENFNTLKDYIDHLKNTFN
ncbi:aminopeptidase [Cyclobacteriaceae bacterium]|nr:aminopeptidase [Cyclobacteriaceae bacterium]